MTKRKTKQKSKQAGLSPVKASIGAEKLENKLDPATKGPKQTGQIITHYGQHVDIETPDGERIQCFLKQNLPIILQDHHEYA